MESSADALHLAWSENWQNLQSNNAAAENLLAELDMMRDKTITFLTDLN